MIPHIIHQSWKTDQVPERWRAFQQSWKANHPHWEYRFWTDDDNRALVAEHFPVFLPAYDAYALPINRADLARCLVVCRFGGLYADMDFESLRPIDGLLEGQEIAFGLEPLTHLRRPSIVERGFKRLVCNALFASVPDHQFWDHMLPILLAAKDETNPLDAAGPFALTRACDSYPRQGELTVFEPPLLYPLDNYGDWVDPADGAKPYAVHHWSGTWWREAVLTNARRRILASRTGADPNAER